MIPSVLTFGVARQSSHRMHRSLSVLCYKRYGSCFGPTPSNFRIQHYKSRSIHHCNGFGAIRHTNIERCKPNLLFIRCVTNRSTTSNATVNKSIERLDQQLQALSSDLQKLTYLIQQSQSCTNETQTLARRAEARAYIIEQKLEDIQTHVIKIPASLNKVGERVETKLRGYLPQRMQDRFQDSKKLLSNKYILWGTVAAGVLFYQYRMRMYQRTSEEVANVAALTLQQDSLRKTIQETLTTVANSPETLQSLSLLFQRLIREEKTEQHLIDLIVRALNSEGVKLAAIRLLELCFQNEELQKRGGEFLKIAATNTVLDESMQKNAGLGLQKALKSVVTSNVPWGWKGKSHDGEDDCNNDDDDNTNDLVGTKSTSAGANDCMKHSNNKEF